MKMYLIAIHKTSVKDKDIAGFRILDLDSKDVKDYDYNAVANVLRKGIAPIEGLTYDKRKGELKGSNGSLDRYPTLVCGNPINRSLVVLNTIDDKGYQVSSFNGKIAHALRYEVVAFASKNGIANGKVVEKDGRKFISAINGTYSNIEFNKSELAKNKQVQMKKNDAALVESLKKQEQAKTSKRIVKTINRPKAITDTNVDPKLLQMVDDISGQTVEQKMAYIMLELKAVRPFCYSVFVCLNRVAALDLDTMGVSLKTLYFNPYFVLERSLPELLYIVIHEIYHISMKHKIREQGRQHKVWNRACDYYINKLIAEEFELNEPGDSAYVKREVKGGYGETTKYKIAIPLDGCYNSKVNTDTDTPESIYEELMEIQRQKQQQQQSQQNQQGQQGNNQQQSNSQGQQGNNQDDSDSDEQEGQSGQDNNKGSKNKENNQNQQSNDQGQQDKEQGQQGKQGQNKEEHNPLEDFADGKEETQSETDDMLGDDEQNNSQGNKSNKNSDNEESSNNKGNSDNQEDSSEEATDSDDITGENFRGTPIPDMEDDMVDSPDERGESSDRAEQIANSILKRAASICRQQKGSFGGDAGGYLEKYVEQALAPKVLWQSLLRNKLTLASQKINTFAAPDKRFRSRGMIMPGPKKLESDTLENVKVCIDTSGSIGPEELGIALAQVEQLLRAFKAEAELLYWDTDIKAIYPFKDMKDLLDKQPIGNGGTDANCIFRYFEEQRDYKIGRKQKPKIVIIFTDGYFGTVDKKYSKYKDTIWVIAGNNSFAPPFGVKAPFKQE